MAGLRQLQEAAIAEGAHVATVREWRDTGTVRTGANTQYGLKRRTFEQISREMYERQQRRFDGHPHSNAERPV